MNLAAPIAIASSRNAREFSTEDDILVDAFAALGITAHIVVWDDPEARWESYRGVLIRSTWDYHTRLPEFMAWLSRVEEKISVWNSPSLIRWNANKRYLLELEGKGVPIVPTLIAGQDSDWERIAQRQWSSVVVKPTVAASAYETLVFDVEMGRPDSPTWHAPRQHAAKLASHSEVLVQPYLDGITVEGETSLVYMDGEVRFAVHKTPKAGDFRVQSEYGGRYEQVSATPRQIEVAEACIAACPEPPLYARIDLVDLGGPRLMEMELIEPELFFPIEPQGALMLADSVLESALSA